MVEVLETKSADGDTLMATITEEEDCWMSPFIKYVIEGILLEDKLKARRIRMGAPMYHFQDGILYRKSFTSPYLRCIRPTQAKANGQVEVTNRDIVAGIKARLDKHRQGWVDELQYISWAHRTTSKESMNETPFGLVYGTGAVIPAEVFIPTTLVMAFDEQQNDEAEKKQKIANQYNKKVKPLDFQLHNLVLRRNEASRQQDVRKLGPRWEGPYRVVGITDNSAYHLETLDGIPL
ncbi:uncharacterized protein [Rutidosis leptorrhynchoides]|uniref:uncharacterized protein n=1 Tax=Rutidosis leptorrhynchoides TaxID=125765 RepID=UPI003A98D7C8